MTEDDLNDTITPEIIEHNELSILVRDSGLEQSKAQFMLEQFTDHYKMAAEWAKKAKGIIVTNENQTVNMQMARTGRLFLRAKRIEIENARKALKESALKEGKAIDMIANFLKDLIIPIETHLDMQEHFVEYKKKAEDERILAEAHAKMEEERVAKEKAQAEELENLRKERETHEKVLAEERKQSEIKLAKERAEREKAEAALRAKQQTEAKAESDRLKAIEQLKKADDSVKLSKLLNDIKAIEYPTGLKSEESNIALKSVHQLLMKAVDILELLTIQEEE